MALALKTELNSPPPPSPTVRNVDASAQRGTLGNKRTQRRRLFVCLTLKGERGALASHFFFICATDKEGLLVVYRRALRKSSKNILNITDDFLTVPYKCIRIINLNRF